MPLEKNEIPDQFSKEIYLRKTPYYAFVTSHPEFEPITL